VDLWPYFNVWNVYIIAFLLREVGWRLVTYASLSRSGLIWRPPRLDTRSTSTWLLQGPAAPSGTFPVSVRVDIFLFARAGVFGFGI
jgi:hypothetical protein